MTKHDDLLTKLANCASACEMCLNSCLEEDNIQKLVSCIRSDRDCAKMCQVTAGFVASNSQFAPQVVELCEKIAVKCAEECEQHEHEHCRVCARACRECAEACRSFAA